MVAFKTKKILLIFMIRDCLQATRKYEPLIMKNNQLQNLKLLSYDELVKRKKTATGAIIGFGIVVVFAAIAGIYIALSKKQYALVAVTLSIPLTILPIAIVLGNINKELKLRNSTNNNQNL